MSESTGHLEPHAGIDPYDNKESRAEEDGQTSTIGRAAEGGPTPTDAPLHDTLPELSGTAHGSPLDGLIMSDEDAKEAVSGDTGPEEPGVRHTYGHPNHR